MGKKIFIFSLILISITVGTIEAQTFKEFPSEKIMQQTGGCQVTGISRNGRYILGGTYFAGGFIYDVLKDNFLLVGASGVSDDGTIVAGFSTRNMETGEVTQLQRPDGNYGFMMTTSISADGHVVTGTGGADWTQLEPFCWVDGKLHKLPYPSTAEVGTFKVNGCRAEGVSDDGSVIFGYFIANPNTYPLIIWKRQADGSYNYEDVWTDLYEPQHGWVYDYDKQEYDFVRGPNPYCRMQPYAMSGDGKLVLIRTQENTEETSPPNKVGIFHVDSRTMELAPWSPNDVIGMAGDFDSRGIANDGTVIGLAFTASLSDAVPFIMYPGEGPQYLNDAFPQFDRLFYYEDNSFRGLPYLLTVISEDARYIAGYSTDVITYVMDEGSTEDFGFWGYVIDLQGEENPDNSDTTGIQDFEYNKNEEATYYTLDGILIEKPAKGFYIKRTSDGKTTKILM